jgi:hypothetical protein
MSPLDSKEHSCFAECPGVMAGAWKRSLGILKSVPELLIGTVQNPSSELTGFAIRSFHHHCCKDRWLPFNSSTDSLGSLWLSRNSQSPTGLMSTVWGKRTLNKASCIANVPGAARCCVDDWSESSISQEVHQSHSHGGQSVPLATALRGVVCDSPSRDTVLKQSLCINVPELL